MQTTFSSSSSVTATPGYRSVFTRDRFLAIWKFCHVVDEEDVALNKSDIIYEVRPLIEHVIQKFRLYYYPGQMLSIDEGMVPTKRRLSYK